MTATRLIYFAMMVTGSYLIGGMLYPGLMAPDTLFQYIQLKSGQISNLHPPIMIYLWQQLEWLIEPGPGSMFAFQWGLYCLSVYLIVTATAYRLIPRLFNTVLLFIPPVFAVMMTVWKDSMMLAFLMFGIASMARFARVPGSGWMILAFASFWMAAALRHNALLAILPLIFCMLYITPRLKKCLWCLCAKTLVIAGVFAVTIGWVNRDNVTAISMFPTIGVWDLAAMSIEEEKVLIPDYALKDPLIDIYDIEELFDPIANVPLCQFVPGAGRKILCMEKIPHRAGAALASEDVSPLFHHWISTILMHPGAYLSHRLNLTCNLIGACAPHSVPFNTRSTPAEIMNLPWYEGPTASELGIIATTQPSSDTQHIIQMLIKMWHDTPLLDPWPYLLIMLIMTIMYPFIQPESSRRSVGLAVLMSGWLMALPLVFIAPNFQLRYLIWPIICASLSVVLMKRQKHYKKKQDLPDRFETPAGAGR